MPDQNLYTGLTYVYMGILCYIIRSKNNSVKHAELWQNGLETQNDA